MTVEATLFDVFRPAYNAFTKATMAAITDLRHARHTPLLRVLEIGAGEMPAPYLHNILTSFRRGIDLVCIDWRGSVFDQPAWSRVESLGRETGNLVTLYRKDVDIRVVNEPLVSARRLRRNRRQRFDVILMNATMHELHEPAEHKRENMYFASTQCDALAGMVPRLQGAFPQLTADGHTITYKGFFYEDECIRLHEAVEGHRVHGAIDHLRRRSRQQRLLLLHHVFDQLRDILEPGGRLVLGDYYYPEWVSYDARKREIANTKQRVPTLHGHDADYFLTPGEILRCALTDQCDASEIRDSSTANEGNDITVGLSYWDLAMEDGQLTSREASEKPHARYRELSRPFDDALHVDDVLRRYFCCELRGRASSPDLKTAFDSCARIQARANDALGGARSVLGEHALTSEKYIDALRTQLFADAGDGRSKVFDVLAKGLNSFIWGWSRARGLSQREAVSIWLSYSPLGRPDDRVSRRASECLMPVVQGWELTAASGHLHIPENAGLRELQWSAACFNAFLAKRTPVTGGTPLFPPSIHAWLVRSAPRAFVQESQTGSASGGAPHGSVDVRSVTIFPPLSFLTRHERGESDVTDRNPTLPDLLSGEIAYCQAFGEPHHVYIELPGPSSSTDTTASVCRNWAVGFERALRDRLGLDEDALPFSGACEGSELPFWRDIYSAFLANLFLPRVPGLPDRRFVEPQRWFSDAPSGAAYDGVWDWLYGMGPKVFGPESYLPPAFFTTVRLPTSRCEAGAGGSAGSLMLFSVRPLEPAVIDFLSMICGAAFSRIRELEGDLLTAQNVRLAETAARGRSLAAFCHQVNHVFGPKSEFPLRDFALTRLAECVSDSRVMEARQAQIRYAAILPGAFRQALLGPDQLMEEWKGQHECRLVCNYVEHDIWDTLVRPILLIIKEAVAKHGAKAREPMLRTDRRSTAVAEMKVPKLHAIDAALFEIFWNAFESGDFTHCRSGEAPVQLDYDTAVDGQLGIVVTNPYDGTALPRQDRERGRGMDLIAALISGLRDAAAQRGSGNPEFSQLQRLSFQSAPMDPYTWRAVLTLPVAYD